MIKRFRDGLDAGLKALWKPPFRSGVRNGGFEQTLRNVCMPYIEDRTGRTAFTESGQRADLLLCGAEDNPESRTRCEFKVNFAAQHSLIPARITEAKSQIERRPGPKKQAADGIVVYAIAELVMLDDDEKLQAHLHNKHVIRTTYKKFIDPAASSARMREAEKFFRLHHFERMPSELEPLKLDDGSGLARLNVWTFYQPPISR